MINFDIVRVRFFSYFISVIMIFAFLAGIFYKQKERGTAFLYSIEFSGGYQIHCSLKNLLTKLTTEDFKKRLENNDLYKNVSIRKFSDTDFLLKFLIHEKGANIPFSSDTFELELKSYIKNIFSDSEIEVIIIDSSFVGPAVGNQITEKAFYSIVLALFLMFLYIWMRFPSWRFSVANIISLMHDVLIILLFLMWGNIEISLDSLIAILFIVGYSINDTIVIFAKIRDSMHLEGISVITSDIINKSVINTFRRTMLTSLFTAIVIFPLWIFGGSSLEILAAPILLGIVFGTYSSIGIASSVLYDLFLFKKKE